MDKIDAQGKAESALLAGKATQIALAGSSKLHKEELSRIELDRRKLVAAREIAAQNVKTADILENTRNAEASA